MPAGWVIAGIAAVGAHVSANKANKQANRANEATQAGIEAARENIAAGNQAARERLEPLTGLTNVAMPIVTQQVDNQLANYPAYQAAINRGLNAYGSSAPPQQLVNGGQRQQTGPNPLYAHNPTTGYSQQLATPTQAPRQQVTDPQIFSFVQQTLNNPSMNKEQRVEAIKAYGRQNGVDVSRLANASGYTAQEAGAYLGTAPQNQQQPDRFGLFNSIYGRPAETPVAQANPEGNVGPFTTAAQAAVQAAANAPAPPAPLTMSPDVPRDQFDADAYLQANPDVARNGMDPYQHYVQWGRKEGRQPFYRAAGSPAPAPRPGEAGYGVNPAGYVQPGGY